MHIWNIKYLTDEINSGQLTERRAFGYFFLVTTLNCLSFSALWLTGVQTPLATIPFGSMILALDLAIVKVGLVMSFRAFQRRRGNVFVQKFTSSCQPVSALSFSAFRSLWPRDSSFINSLLKIAGSCWGRQAQF